MSQSFLTTAYNYIDVLVLFLFSTVHTFNKNTDCKREYVKYLKISVSYLQAQNPVNI
jgi:hypothetical protein